MLKPIDTSKPVQTRCGLPARIICTNLLGLHSLAVAVKDKNTDYESIIRTDEYGRLGGCDVEDVYDIVNVPEKHVRWANIYPGTFANTYQTQEEADNGAASYRIACIRIEFEEGEGL